MSPIELDKRPRSAKGKWKRRNGEPVGPIKPPGAAEPVETLRIRMLQSLSSRMGAYRAGQSIVLPVEIARSWIGFGLAEQDKSLDGPPETK